MAEETKQTLEELAAKLSTSQNRVAELEGENDKLAATNTALANEVGTLRKGLSLSRTKDLSPELRKLVKEKVDAGLPEHQAIEVAFRQMARNEELSKAAKPAAAATPSTKPPRR